MQLEAQRTREGRGGVHRRSARSPRQALASDPLMGPADVRADPGHDSRALADSCYSQAPNAAKVRVDIDATARYARVLGGESAGGGPET